MRLKHENIQRGSGNNIYDPRGVRIYKKRKEKVELPFGRNLNGWAFLLRGLKGVNAEMAILSTCFNISRMVTIIRNERYIGSVQKAKQSNTALNVLKPMALEHCRNSASLVIIWQTLVP
ncbi:hypothetical protein [Candidatus Magnetominusculus xianensis]|uniref:hypothetical protein n=1 Tax=Candidatus Magnetominusculus xianensis TaxID=1748249 RepID=UPI00338E7916